MILSLGKCVEHAGEDETKKMRTGVDAEAPGAQRELFVAVEIGLHDRRMRFARMQVDRHAERLGAFEDAPERLLVEKPALRVTVDHRSLEVQAPNRTVELVRRGGRVRSRQRGKAGEAIGMRADRLEQEIVRFPCRRNGFFGGECLTAGLIVRKHLPRDAGRIHGGETRLAEIQQPGDDVEAQHLLAVVPAVRARRKIVHLLRQDEVLLERDDLHRPDLMARRTHRWRSDQVGAPAARL